MIRSLVGAVLAVIASLVRLVTSGVAGLLLLHAVFVHFSADPANSLVDAVAGVRDQLGGFARNLFSLADARTAETVDSAVAAAVWLVGGQLVARTVAGLVSGKAPAKAGGKD